jgi:hypothetical protein
MNTQFSQFYFKGLCHEMNNFLKVLKVKYVLYVHKFFWCLVMEKMEIQVFACFYEKIY